MRAESKAYIQDPERQQQEYADYANYKINEAVKGSMDQLNGRTATVDTINNGNGTAAGLTTAAVVTVEQQQQQQVLPHQHNYNAIETVAHQHHPMQTEKKNTDV
ncbi:hypothetical protein Avbf_06140 [Armadillidium vulgare]|uniref:Uncharacterized protein n=1 Tax=Armadillidium nasatum TaxID=96803 RepID=A0A5N5T411_9CRUS|nr:hypothetical protein Anas_14000 [Armadillidium nasatum]KAB7501156.1 hypothetical protein Anas_05281 [Armadillidium nasatum]RXG72233.1 hypothetical protein Avbf_06140 [Armadillidium vulgare]